MLWDGCPRKLILLFASLIQFGSGLTFRLNQGIWPNFDISNFNEVSKYQLNSGPCLLTVRRENPQYFKIARVIQRVN